MPRSLTSFLCLLPGLLYVPAVLLAYRLTTGLSVGDLLTTSMIVILYYIPILGFISAARPHFKPRHALYPFAVIALMELWALVPDRGPLDLLGDVLSLFMRTEDTEVLGKSAFVLLGALVPLLSLLHRVSLFRLVAATMALAQCTTLVFFHIVALSMPFEGMLAQERQLAAASLQVDGSLERLCTLEGRSCFTGSLESARSWAEQTLPTPRPALALIEDTATHAPLLHGWMQNPVEDQETGKMDQLSMITAFKPSPSQITLMISSAGPTLLYHQLRSAIGLLLVVFHAVWIPLGLAIIARHGSYVFRRGRWRRAS